jgi:predicted ATPase/DNA-binding SARP family transcriptional activator
MEHRGRAAVRVLGPIELHTDAGDVTPSGDLQRRLLAALTLRRGEVVRSEELVDVLWPDRPPRDPDAALQTHVFRLRQLLPDGAVASNGAGYRLDPAAVDVDADGLADALATAAERPDDAAEVLDAALGAWRSAPYPELADTDGGRAEAARLEELRGRAREERAAAAVAAGRAADVVAELTTLVAEEPLRERPRSLLMAALAATGRQADALRAYDEFRRVLGDELGIEPSPSLVAQHAALLAGTGPPDAEAPAATPSPALTGRARLPLPRTSLIGREALVDQALQLATDQRLVTLLGTGGVGKTRLVLEVARRLAADRPDRPVVLCELAGATAPTAEEAVATALGVEAQQGSTLAERIAAVLEHQELVLVLDNCEHVVEPIAELVDAVLRRAPEVTVLTTSQERLRIDGEHLCPVPPLPADAGDPGAPAVALFLERAAAVLPGWEPTEDELTTVTEIVGRLDGLPLAIELAAARAHTSTIDEIAAGLDRRFRLLSTGSRTSSRHRSLHAAVSWSFDLLDPADQAFLVRLSPFAGSFTAADAAAVAGTDAAEAADRLLTLAERSLVVRGEPGRYSLLETLRAFGTEELVTRDLADETHERHACHLLAFVERAKADQSLDDPPPVLFQLDAALPDLRIAIDWFVANRRVDEASRLIASLQDFGFHRVRGEVLNWAVRVQELDPDGEHPLAPAVESTAALGAWLAGDPAGNEARTRRCLELAERAGGPVPMLAATAAGNVGLFTGDLDEALRWYQVAAEVADNRFDTVTARGCVVLSYAYGPDQATAEAEADALLEAVGDWRSAVAAYAWYTAGEAVQRTDEALAMARFERALELAREHGSFLVEGTAGASAASIEARSGDPDKAAAEFRRLIDLWRGTGMRATQWTMLRTVAVLLERMGRLEDAAALLRAVTTTEEGNRVFGDDAVTLEALGQRLRHALGDEGFERAAEAGEGMDGEAAAAHALRALAGGRTPEG